MTSSPFLSHRSTSTPHYVDAIAMRLNANGDEHYYLQDANFNVTAVVDNTGTVKERYSYTPYGEVTILDLNFSAVPGNVSTISNEHLYTGRRLDPETGLQLNRNRFYAAGLGRWVNRDPIGYADGWNLYGYIGGMPTIGTDPMGQAICTPWVTVKRPCTAADQTACQASCKAKGELGGVMKNCVSITRTCSFCFYSWGQYHGGGTCFCGKGKCPPCPKPPGSQTDTTHDHGKCKEKTGSNTHWHYFEYHQNPKTCKCFGPFRKFGGCGPAPK